MAKHTEHQTLGKIDNYNISAATVDEISLFYSNEKIDAERGCIGYVRVDFGLGGEEFWHAWFERCGELKTQDFVNELNHIINHLREDGNMLHNLAALSKYCLDHPDTKLDIKFRKDTYGFRIDTEAHSYYFRGMLTQADYNLYCFCYHRDRLEQFLAAAYQEPEKNLSSDEPALTMVGM